MWLLTTVGLWQLQRWAWGLLLALFCVLVADAAGATIRSGDILDFGTAAPFVPMLGLLLSGSVIRAVWLPDGHAARPRTPQENSNVGTHQQWSLEAKLQLLSILVTVLLTIVQLVFSAFLDRVKALLVGG